MTFNLMFGDIGILCDYTIKTTEGMTYADSWKLVGMPTPEREVLEHVLRSSYSNQVMEQIYADAQSRESSTSI